jgi:hypothetical protein
LALRAPLASGELRKIRRFPLDMSFGRPLRFRNQFSLRPPKASAGSTATKPDRTQVRSGFLFLFARRLAKLISLHAEGIDRVRFRWSGARAVPVCRSIVQ